MDLVLNAAAQHGPYRVSRSFDPCFFSPLLFPPVGYISILSRFLRQVRPFHDAIPTKKKKKGKKKKKI